MRAKLNLLTLVLVSILSYLTSPAFSQSNAAKKYNEEGEAYYVSRKYDLAIERFSQAIKIYPRYGNAWGMRARCYNELKQYDKAINDYTEAIRINPSYVDVRAELYYELKQYEKAILDYSESIRIEPKAWGQYRKFIGRGNSYFELKQYDKAIADYSQSIRLYSGHAEPWLMRGGCYYTLKQFEKAIIDFSEALRFTADSRTFEARGHSYFFLKQYEKAITDYSEVIRRNPQSTRARFGRAQSYRNLKENDKAKADFEAVLSYDPQYQPAIQGLVDIDKKMNAEGKTDKTGPVIALTEPAVTRGFVITSASEEVMVKGTANDPGGLKEVLINGKSVYSQNGGAFWGSVALTSGMNKVTIQATDVSGNVSIQTFEIKKKQESDLPIAVVAASAQDDLYRNGEAIARKALKELNAGNVSSADSLIRTSINVYPSFAVIDYLKAMAQLPDIAGANNLMEVLRNKILSMPDKVILAPRDATWKYRPEIVLQDKNNGLYVYHHWCTQINRMYAGRSYIINSLNVLNDLPVQKQVGRKYTPAYSYQEENKLAAAEFEENYTLYKELARKAGSPMENVQLRILILREEYQQALEFLNSRKYDARDNGRRFKLYARTGDQKALEILNKWEEESTLPFIHSKTKRDLGLSQANTEAYYDIALFYLKREDYEMAIKSLDKSENLKSDSSFSWVDDATPLWDHYRAYGDAYTGLKQFNKARDYYSLSLLYYPENDKVIKALAAMEQMTARETSLDKTAPIIVLTEPAPSRGIKVVAAGANFMIKGTATDISGIKEVLVNGVKMFVQPTGEFWGDVPMKSGGNVLKIQSTDLAGNTGEKVFEIQGTLTSTPSNDIIAVNDYKGENYCLLIAAQNYQDSAIPSLDKPIGDAIKLKKVLRENYGFSSENIISLFNPTSTDIKRQLLEISIKLKPEDNLIIFYAGHGIWVEKEKKGYWLMIDAEYKDVGTWLPNKVVLDLIAKLPTRHTLLITDACFSGSVFKTRGISDKAPTAIKELDNKITRVAITSGNDTEVPDESVFMKYLIKALSQNKEPYLTAQKMFITQILEAVMTESKTEPRYGTLELAGHVGGDFIFTKK
ncbi:MAG: tetratricopeptide repeat protein [Bacteroidota bacterium]